MAVKAKKTKKTQKKTTKAKTKKRASVKSSSSQQKIDEMLVRISPALQEKINQLVSALGSSKEGKLGDLSFLAGKILFRAQEISRGLKALRKAKTKKVGK